MVAVADCKEHIGRADIFYHLVDLEACGDEIALYFAAAHVKLEVVQLFEDIPVLVELFYDALFLV